MFKVSASPFYGESEIPTTKSANFNESDSYKVTDFNVWVYDFSTGELVNGGGQYKTYFTDPKEVNGYYLFPDFKKKYDIYMLANLGKQEAPQTRADAEAYRYKFSNFDTFKTKGLPMVAHYSFVPSDPSTNHDLQLMRLVSRFSIKFDFAKDNDYDFVLKKAVVRNSAKVVSPFVKESKAVNESDVTKFGDELSVSDLSANGGEVYMVENIQGDKVFKDAVKRTADNVTKEKYKYCTTYLEFSGELKRKDGSGYRSVTCLYYFGEGTFAGVRRNYYLPIVLTMTNTFTNNDNWSVVPMDPFSNAVVKFKLYEEDTYKNPYECTLSDDDTEYKIDSQAFIGDDFADDVNYKIFYDEKALKKADVDFELIGDDNGEIKGSSTLICIHTNDISKIDTTFEFKAVDKHGAVLGKFYTKIHPAWVEDISISESDKIINYEKDFDKPGYGKVKRIKLNVTPRFHCNKIVIKDVSYGNGNIAKFEIDNSNDELIVTPRTLGRVSVTLSADGHDYKLNFVIKQKIIINVVYYNDDFTVQPNINPYCPIHFSIKGILWGSIEAITDDGLKTIKDERSFIDNLDLYFEVPRRVHISLSKLADEINNPRRMIPNGNYFRVYFIRATDLDLKCKAVPENYSDFMEIEFKYDISNYKVHINDHLILDIGD